MTREWLFERPGRQAGEAPAPDSRIAGDGALASGRADIYPPPPGTKRPFEADDPNGVRSGSDPTFDP